MRRPARAGARLASLAPLVTALLVLDAPAAVADDPAPGAVDNRVVADRLQREAVALRGQGKHAEALEKAEEARQLLPDSYGLAQVALAEFRTGRRAAAYAKLRKALADKNDARIAADLERFETAKRWMEARVIRLTLDIEPREAQVAINGVNQVAPFDDDVIVVDDETIELKVQAPGFLPHTTTFRVEKGQQLARTIKLRPVPRVPAPPAASSGGATDPRAASSAQSRAHSGSDPVLIGLAITTGVLVVGAIVTGIMALDRTADFDAKNNDKRFGIEARQAARDNASQLRLINAGLWAGAVVSTGFGAYVYFSSSDDEHARAPVSALGLTARGDF